MKVIGFCGLPGSGKSTAIEAIKDLGVIITMGDVIREEAKKRNLSSTDENLGKIAKELREKGGPEIIAKKCVELIKIQKKNVVFVDGIRSPHELKIFRQYWKFPLIVIELSEENRFERLFKRARRDDPLSLEEIKKRDERELGFGLKKVVESAEYKIKNASTIEDLQKRTKEIVLEIIKNY
ncbi:MAG TPA: AAA family ATPase [Candidatus Lokiarchaeia archaeon]